MHDNAAQGGGEGGPVKKWWAHVTNYEKGNCDPSDGKKDRKRGVNRRQQPGSTPKKGPRHKKVGKQTKVLREGAGGKSLEGKSRKE